jgi:hypothetical protein
MSIGAFKSKNHCPEFLLKLTKELGNFALQLVGALMLYDLVIATTDLAHTLLQKTSLNEDLLNYESETMIKPTNPNIGMLARGENPSTTYVHYNKRCPCMLSDFTRF